MKRKVAEGGMAEIYLCAAVGPEGFEKEVAIKVVRSFLARDDGFMKMFVDEARLASRLNHANVVQIFDFAKHEDSYFIAMEFVRGVSLWDLRRRCRELGIGFPATLAAEIAVHTARGLHYAHSLTERGRPIGLVHRDVTPHNVLISFDGAIKLTDFGIAKASGNQTSTAAGMLKGKFAYMSPEQARGEKIDARTDVFALGIVLWEMLTGGRLFEGDSDVAVLRAVQQSYISPPNRLNPDVPPELDAVVMKALERELPKRYQTAQELERALANFILRHARSVEDTNVGMFVSQMFKDELDEMREAEYELNDGTHSTAKEPPLEATGVGPTAVVHRDHSKPRESSPRPPPPGEKPKTALLPSTRPRGPLEDDDDDPSQQRTARMRELSTPSPAPVVLKDSFAKEVAEASRALLDEEARAKASTTDSVPRTSQPVQGDAPATPAAPAPAQRRSSAAWVAVALVAAGFIGSMSYLLMFRPKDGTALVTPSPPAQPAPAPVVASPPPVEPPVEPPPAEPERKVEAEPAPQPAPAQAAEAVKPAEPAPATVEKPKPAAMGTLAVDARPFAELWIDGKVRDPELQGVKRFPLKPGRHKVTLKHPKRQLTNEVDIAPNQVTPLTFRALEP